MNTLLVVSSIDFADSEYGSCELTYEHLIIRITSWDNKKITILIQDPIQFSYKPSDFIQGFFEHTGSSPFLDEALRLKYERIPENHSYKLFQMLDISDFPFIEVVAQSATVTEE